jgi:hypothetical protein
MPGVRVDSLDSQREGPLPHHDIETGHGFWLGDRWNFGAVARFLVTRAGINQGATATVIHSSLSLAITWHRAKLTAPRRL